MASFPVETPVIVAPRFGRQFSGNTYMIICYCHPLAVLPLLRFSCRGLPRPWMRGGARDGVQEVLSTLSSFSSSQCFCHLRFGEMVWPYDVLNF